MAKEVMTDVVHSGYSNSVMIFPAEKKAEIIRRQVREPIEF